MRNRRRSRNRSIVLIADSLNLIKQLSIDFSPKHASSREIDRLIESSLGIEFKVLRSADLLS